MTGAFAVVLNEDKSKVLLHQRRDFRIWSLPGGGVETGETPENAAIREVIEETGYEISIVAFVGEYFRPQLDKTSNINYLFLGQVIGGGRLSSGSETKAVEWFDLKHLPNRCIPSARIYISDAVSFSGIPLQKTIYIPFWQRLIRRIAFSIHH